MEFLILLVIIAVIAAIIVGIYNRLVALQQNRRNAFADINVQLKQRFDLVPQLVETVKGYARHEQQILENVTKARAGVTDAKTEEKRLQAEYTLGGALMGLFAVAENYPELKGDQNFRKLMAELADIENKIAASRRFFNNATNEYNTAIQQFPANVLAGLFKFYSAPYFEINEREQAAMEKAPNVSF